MNNKINVYFFGYRDWAINIINEISVHEKINDYKIFETFDEYKIVEQEILLGEINIDICVFIGWSWILPSGVTDRMLCVGIHPSDLPAYRGGSPIQNQIIDGLKESKVTLMTLSSKKLDAGNIWLKERFSLEGDSIQEIFLNIQKSSVELLNKFFNMYPNIISIEQDINAGSYKKRRHEKESKIEWDEFKEDNFDNLYNKIRCLTEPYPNAFIEDSFGNRMYITGVRFEKL